MRLSGKDRPVQKEDSLELKSEPFRWEEPENTNEKEREKGKKQIVGDSRDRKNSHSVHLQASRRYYCDAYQVFCR